MIVEESAISAISAISESTDRRSRPAGSPPLEAP